MKSNRIVVFAAPQQCTDEVKVVLGGPQVSDVGDLRNLPQKKKPRKGREVCRFDDILLTP